MPWPPPMHMVTRPRRPPVRSSSWSALIVRIAPVAPTGWPSAIAPPFGFTFAGSSPSPLLTASACAAKASFEFDDVEVVDREAGLLEQLLHRRDRADAHHLGPDAGDGVAEDPRPRLQPGLLGGVGGGEHDRRRAVVEAAGVAGGDAAVLPERRPKLRQRLGGGRLRVLVGGEADRLAFHLDLDRHDLAGEAALLDRRRRAGLALERERVLRLAGDLVLGSRRSRRSRPCGRCRTGRSARPTIMSSACGVAHLLPPARRRSARRASATCSRRRRRARSRRRRARAPARRRRSPARPEPQSRLTFIAGALSGTPPRSPRRG